MVIYKSIMDAKLTNLLYKFCDSCWRQDCDGLISIFRDVDLTSATYEENELFKTLTIRTHRTITYAVFDMVVLKRAAK